MTFSSTHNKRRPALLATTCMILVHFLFPAFAFHDCIESVQEARRRRRRRRRRHRRRRRRLEATISSNACSGGLCVGMKNGPHEGGPASYPVAWDRDLMTALSVQSTMTVPEYPENTDGITNHTWVDVFFGDAGLGRRNQLVPQLILGNAVLDGSSGPPDYQPSWGKHDSSWTFGAHYFFETFNVSTQKVDAHAAYGQLFSTLPGEVLWTEFRLEPGGNGCDVDNPRWVLTMGVVDDGTRTSTLVIDRPYMGLGTDWGTNKTFSWTEEPYHQMCINACWELYGANDSTHLPGSGASFSVEIHQPAPGSFEFQSEWEQDEGRLGGGCPSSIVREHHNASVQHVHWDISVDPLQGVSPFPINWRWEAWRAQYSNLVGAFASSVEETRRREIFEENIQWFQVRGGSYLLDEMAILTAEEFRQRGKASCPSSMEKGKFAQQLVERNFSCPVLSYLDIRSAAGKDAIEDFIIDYRGTQVTPVKNQGAFGTCWSFGFAETIESLGVRQGYALTNVSNQEVIDCCPSCRGSAQDASFGFVIGSLTINGRLATDDAYPYHGSPERCSSANMSQSQLAPARVGGCLRVMDDADRTGKPILIGLAILGPAAFGIDAACLRGYKSGVITNCTDAHVDHEVLLVGAGVDEESGVAFFRAKNSWGAKWGEKGYFRFAQKGGQMGMASVVFATDHAVNGPALDPSL